MSNRVVWQPRRVHILIDPDKWDANELGVLFSSVPDVVASIIVGGTFIHTNRFEEVMNSCLRTELPVGNIVSAGPPSNSISRRASFLLIPIVFGTGSTRFVFDHIIQAVPFVDQESLEVVPYAYIMLAGGELTSAEYFTQTIALPRGKFEILKTLGLTAQYIGLEGIYLEAGSGAPNPVTPSEVRAIATTSKLPILVGGGIRTASNCRELFDAGATGLVIGTAVEERRSLTWLEGL